MTKWDKFAVEDRTNTRFHKTLGVSAYPTMKSMEPFPMGHVVVDRVSASKGPTAVMHFYTHPAGGGFLGDRQYRKRSAALATALLFVEGLVKDGTVSETTFYFVVDEHGKWRPDYDQWDDFVFQIGAFAELLPEGFDVRILIPTKS